jgi:hypothetical protein
MKLLSLLFLLLLSIPCYADTTYNVVTGFGYLTDSNGHITSKAEYPIGHVVINTGYSYTEVANQAALDAITVYVPPVVISPTLCADYDNYIALATSLGLPGQATTAQVQTYITTLEGDGSNQANVNNAVKISLEFLSLMNDIEQNGGSWAGIRQC